MRHVSIEKLKSEARADLDELTPRSVVDCEMLSAVSHHSCAMSAISVAPGARWELQTLSAAQRIGDPTRTPWGAAVP